MADVSETLDALERKLRDLERELGAPAAAPAPPPPAPAASRPAPPPPGAGLDDLARQIDDLTRFREQLQRIGRELEDDYARVIARLGDPEHEAAAPEPEPEPEPPEPPAEPEPGAARTVVLDAGPFADLAALGAVEEALAALPGVAAVDVTGFEGRRARFELRFGGPAVVLDELADALPDAIVLETDEPERLTADFERRA